MIPPINSHFQAMIRNAIKIYDGMRWIRKSPSCCQIVCPGVNASRANKLIKRIAMMQITRESQCNTLIEVFNLITPAIDSSVSITRPSTMFIRILSNKKHQPPPAFPSGQKQTAPDGKLHSGIVCGYLLQVLFYIRRNILLRIWIS